jgi:glutamine---fructose-6-phosphate transaminase (isomerizing)
MSKMLEEIREQPAALSHTLEHGLRDIGVLRKHIDRRRPRLVILVARGTSDNAAQFGRYLLEITTGIPVSLAAPSIITLYKSRLDLKDVLVCGISQSGESTDTNAYLEQARKRGAMTVGITNNAESRMIGVAEHVIQVVAGTEQSVAATKTYSCQLLALYLLAYALRAKVRRRDLSAIPDLVESALRVDRTIQGLAQKYGAIQHAVTIGRGLNYANALEWGLKLMETCYVVAERFSAADLMHGPIALIEPAFPVFVFAPGGVTRPSMDELLAKLESLKARTLVITDGVITDGHPAGKANYIYLPGSNGKKTLQDLYTPIPFIVPAQLFSAHLAQQKGLDPDHPRTLNKITLTM